MKNLIQQTVRIIDSEHNVILTLPPSDRRVEVVRELVDPVPSLDVDGVTVPISQYSAPTRIDGLPAEDDPEPILVPLAVAAAMRELGFRHAGGVFTPQPLIFDSDGANTRPVGTPGLIRHDDLAPQDEDDLREPGSQYSPDGFTADRGATQ